MVNRLSTWRLPFGFCSARFCRSSVESVPLVSRFGDTAGCRSSRIRNSTKKIWRNSMSSLALINEFLGQPPNASEHGYQIDHILEFAHWFMGTLFLGWSAFFVFVLIRFRRSRHPKADHAGVRSGISTHLEFSVVLIEAVLLIGFAIPL